MVSEVSKDTVSASSDRPAPGSPLSADDVGLLKRPLVPIDGQSFSSEQDWVNRAKRALTSHPEYLNAEHGDNGGWRGPHFTALCFDQKGRRVRNGGDFKRATEDEAYPVWWIWPDQIVDALSLPTDRRAEADIEADLPRQYEEAGRIIERDTPPSAGPEAGLETVAWRWTDGDAKHDTVRLATYDPVRYPHVQNVTELVTRQSAAAALEAAAKREGELRRELSEMDALRKSIFSALLNDAGVMVAPGEEPDAVRRLSDRATRAEAQVADRDKRIAELEVALRKVRDLETRDCHDGYDDRGNYVYRDVIFTDEAFPIIDQALSAIPTPGRE